MLEQIRSLNRQYDSVQEPYRFLIFFGCTAPSVVAYYLNPVVGLLYMGALLGFRLLGKTKVNG